MTLQQILEDTRPLWILDVNAGEGTNGKLVRKVWPEVIKLDAMEKRDLFVNQFNLIEIYQEVITDDIRLIHPQLIEHYDLVILNDVFNTQFSIDEAYMVMKKIPAEVVIIQPHDTTWTQTAIEDVTQCELIETNEERAIYYL